MHCPTSALALTLAAAILPAAARPASAQAPARICLAPATVQASTGTADAAATAVRESFTSFLTGPSLAVAPLTSRLESQAREEARAAGCPYLLLTSVKHVRKTGGGGLLGRMAGSAVQQGAWTAGASAGSTVGRIAAGAAAGAAGQAAYDYAGSIKTKDELTLATRLEAGDGKVLVERTGKRKAHSDGEDLLTPLVQEAAEQVAAAVTRRPDK